MSKIKNLIFFNKQKNSSQEWTRIIKPETPFFSFPLKEVLSYKDLLFLFVYRDFVTFYKQTILGPLWFFVQPILITIIFTIVFGKIADISTDGIPHLLFYLGGITVWNYFSACWNDTSDIFRKNQHIFSKVYFPRIIRPLSIVITNLFRFLIQFFLFLIVFFYYFFTTSTLQPNWVILLLPLLIIIMAFLGLSFGMIVSSLTTKYRDLVFLIEFGIHLWMYATPIVYPLSIISPQKQWLLVLNPMTSIVETFKYGFFGIGTFNWWYLIYSIVFSILIFLFSLFLFNKIEKSFIDVI